MKILLMMFYLLILILLVIAIDKVNGPFGTILACSEKVKAKHKGYVMSRPLGSKNLFQMKVTYEYEGRQITTLLLDNYSLSFFGKHASGGEQEVYIDPKKPGRAVLFRKRMIIKYSIIYTILVVLSVLCCILIATSIF